MPWTQGHLKEVLKVFESGNQTRDREIEGCVQVRGGVALRQVREPPSGVPVVRHVLHDAGVGGGDV